MDTPLMLDPFTASILKLPGARGHRYPCQLGASDENPHFCARVTAVQPQTVNPKS